MKSFLFSPRWLVGWCLFASGLVAVAQYPAGLLSLKDGSAVLLQDYAIAPLTSRTPDTFPYTNYPPPTNFSDQLSRINFLRVEPPAAPLASSRVFVCDLNRYLYTLNRSNQQFSVYIDFEATFPKFDNNPGFAGGLVTFQFDPGYATNGIFYTVHTENPNKGGSGDPANTNAVPPAGYTNTTVIAPPAGTVSRHGVLIEWKDTNVANGTFEGTARELLRVGFTGNIHPMGDLLFNPNAQPGDWDFGNLYISNGDGGAGETGTNDARHLFPQRLDVLNGKILRITPNVNLRPGDLLSSNGCYRIPTTGPSPNPFTATNSVFTNLAAARPEVFAYGFRNPHRISWDAATDTLIENDIGLHSWEEVNLIHRGTNYGYAEREGIEQLFVSLTGGGASGVTGSRLTPAIPFPTNTDFLTVTGLANAVTPAYPVASYSHREGNAISSGFVYRGRLMPQLRGKYVFGDIVNARLFYCDLAEMLAADDGVRTTQAAIHELQVVHDNPLDAPDLGPLPRRLWDAVAMTYTNRGGLPGAQRLPGGSSDYTTWTNDVEGVAYGKGRADIRLALDGDGELYLLSKSDGGIRKFAAALSPPLLQGSASNGVVQLQWTSVPGRTYRLQSKAALTDASWSDVPGDVVATGISSTTTNAPASARFYRVVESPSP
ncbi:MAG: hypothetical protein RLY20_853 [Verrucomicrobiota bacterium]|jgi:hypothetical protein